MTDTTPTAPQDALIKYARRTSKELYEAACEADVEICVTSGLVMNASDTIDRLIAALTLPASE